MSLTHSTLLLNLTSALHILNSSPLYLHLPTVGLVSISLTFLQLLQFQYYYYICVLCLLLTAHYFHLHSLSSFPFPTFVSNLPSPRFSRLTPFHSQLHAHLPHPCPDRLVVTSHLHLPHKHTPPTPPPLLSLSLSLNSLRNVWLADRREEEKEWCHGSGYVQSRPKVMFRSPPVTSPLVLL